MTNLHRPPASLGTNDSIGRTAEARRALADVGFVGCCGRSFPVILGLSIDRTLPVVTLQVLT